MSQTMTDRCKLFDAIRQKDLTAVSQLLDVANKEKTPLSDVADEKGRTPLWYAVNSCDADLVALLLKNPGRNLARLDSEDGLSLLHYAVCKNSAAITKMLLDAGADVNIKAQGEIYIGYTPLHFAVHRSSDDVVQTLLSHPDIQINARAENGQTPLHVCCTSGWASTAKLLIETEGIDLMIPDARHRITPGMLAVASGKDEILELLLEQKIIRDNIDKRDKNGDTMLHHAFRIQLQRAFNQSYPISPAEECIAYRLVIAGADINARNSERLEPLFFASKPFRQLLQLAYEHHDVLPKNLSELVSKTEEQIRAEFTGPLEEDVEELVAVLARYTLKFKQALEEELNRKGPCKLIQLKPRGVSSKTTKKKRVSSPKKGRQQRRRSRVNPPRRKSLSHPNVSSSSDDEPESESEESETSSSEDEKKDKSKEKAAMKLNSTEESNSAEVPKGHPNILGGDISKCPFFAMKQKQQQEQQEKQTAVVAKTEPMVTTKEVETKEAVEVAKPKGKCPIPFHNHLVKPATWIWLGLIVVAVIIARNV